MKQGNKYYGIIGVISLLLSTILFLMLGSVFFLERYVEEMGGTVFTEEMAYLNTLPLGVLIGLRLLFLLIGLYTLYKKFRLSAGPAELSIARSWTLAKQYFWKFFLILLGGFIVLQVSGGLLSMLPDNQYIRAGGQTVLFLFTSLLILRLASISLDVDSSSGSGLYNSMLQRSRSLVPWAFASFMGSIVILLGSLLFIIPGIYLAIRLKFRGLFIVDKGYTVLEGCKASRRITKGHIGEILVLQLYQFFITIVGFCLFFVGLFISIPMVHISTVSIYKKLLQEKETDIREQLDNSSL